MNISPRQRLMAICAEASEAELAAVLAQLGPAANAQDIRPPEIGLVMVRGRIGGDGAAFNLGEATMTRAVVRVGQMIGHGHVLGRAPAKARAAATIDALGQSGQHLRLLQQALIEPVEARLAEARTRQAAASAATRVDFFTMVRGDD